MSDRVRRKPGRPTVAGGRPTVVSARFSDPEVRYMDANRGSLSRSEWLRWLQQRAMREGVTLEAQPPIRRV